MGGPAYRWPAYRGRRMYGAGARRRAWPRIARRSSARGTLAAVGAADAITLFESDGWQVQRDQEVFEEILDHADLVVQAVVTL